MVFRQKRTLLVTKYCRLLEGGGGGSSKEALNTYGFPRVTELTCYFQEKGLAKFYEHRSKSATAIVLIYVVNTIKFIILKTLNTCSESRYYCVYLRGT